VYSENPSDFPKVRFPFAILVARATQLTIHQPLGVINMKNKLYLLTTILLLLTSKLISQNLNGIWLSAFSLETSKKNITNRTDSIFSRTFFILDFIDKENVVFKPIGKKPENGKYSIIKNNIRIKLENELIKGELKDNRIVLIARDSLKFTTKVYLNKITHSTLKESDFPNKSFFYNSSWSIESDTISRNFGIKFHFLDKSNIDHFGKNIVLITKNEGIYGFTHNGNYDIDTYKNHFFIGVYNEQEGEENIYHFSKLENNTFYSDTYEEDYSLINEPKFIELKITKSNLLTSKEISLLISKLKGKWKTEGNPLLYTISNLKSKKIENQSFEFVFKNNNDFEIIKHGIIINKNSKVPKTVNIKGKWNISNTGNYIKLEPNDGRIKYITIKKLSSNNLKMYYDVKTMEENQNSYYSTLIELTK
jgi:hypothetical protein